MKVALLLVVLLVGCSSGSSGSSASTSSGTCDGKAEEIRQAAQKRGLTVEDVCEDKTPAVQKEFGAACAELAACRADGG
jgi:hypothetical protein